MKDDEEALQERMKEHWRFMRLCGLIGLVLVTILLLNIFFSADAPPDLYAIDVGPQRVPE